MAASKRMPRLYRSLPAVKRCRDLPMRIMGSPSVILTLPKAVGFEHWQALIVIHGQIGVGVMVSRNKGTVRRHGPPIAALFT